MAISTQYIEGLILIPTTVRLKKITNNKPW